MREGEKYRTSWEIKPKEEVGRWKQSWKARRNPICARFEGKIPWFFEFLYVILSLKLI